jgi:hypothetical protein
LRRSRYDIVARNASQYPGHSWREIEKKRGGCPRKYEEGFQEAMIRIRGSPRSWAGRYHLRSSNQKDLDVAKPGQTFRNSRLAVLKLVPPLGTIERYAAEVLHRRHRFGSATGESKILNAWSRAGFQTPFVAHAVMGYMNGVN